MTAAAPTARPDAGAAPTPSAGQVAWIFAKHLTSLAFPAVALAFVWTGPHAWWVAALFLAPLVVAFALDTRTLEERRQPVASLPAWPFDALVYTLAGLQFLVVFELCRMYQTQAIFSVDSVMIFLVVGSSSGFSIITAHELIHRTKAWERLLGRLLLCTVLYEHFYTEHLRGHHVRVGTPADPATARFGERFEPFFRRTVPAQFASAWRLEARRLGDEDMKLFDRRMLGNRILHGIAVGWAMAFAAWAAFGFAAFFAFLLQAFTAIRLLEAVNYFEHWGLVRRQRKVRPVDSWDTHAWFTYYGLTGLSRHADHHAFPARPFQQLRVFDEAPVLPAGYVGMVDLVMGRNEEFRHRATLELANRQLGPFDPEADVAPDLRERAQRALTRARAFETAIEAGTPPNEAAVEASQPTTESTDAPTPPRSALARAWGGLPAFVRVGLVLLGIAAGASLGGWIESGASGDLAGRFAMAVWILAVFTVVINVRRHVELRVGATSSWVFFFGAVAALGALTDVARGALGA